MKPKNSKRNLSLTALAREVLKGSNALADASTSLCWTPTPERAASASALDHCHARLRKLLGWSEEFVLHSLRHTFGTRLGEAGADAFTIMRIMGHSSITVSQRYVHPTPETMERAFDALQAHAEQAAEKSSGVATIPAKVLAVPRLEVQ
jgi:integrase